MQGPGLVVRNAVHDQVLPGSGTNQIPEQAVVQNIKVNFVTHPFGRGKPLRVSLSAFLSICRVQTIASRLLFPRRVLSLSRSRCELNRLRPVTLPGFQVNQREFILGYL